MAAPVGLLLEVAVGSAGRGVGRRDARPDAGPDAGPDADLQAERETEPETALATELERLASVVERHAPDAPVAVAIDPSARAALWAVRERHTEALNQLGPPVKLDVTLPLPAVAAFCERMRAELPGVVLFGHLGDGNVHVNVPGLGADDAGAAAAEDLVLGVVAAMGGSISAEHGIGRAKRAHLHLARSEAELELFRAIKAAFDPAGICNPAVLLPPAVAHLPSQR